MPYWMVVLVLLAGVAATVGLGGIAAGFPSVQALVVVGFLAAFAMAMLARPRTT